MDKRRKVAVYCGTKNLYGDMETALKSLLAHADVDKVYFITEGEVSIFLPECVEVIDASCQNFFLPSSPNYHQKWTYMVLMRAALTKLLPDEDVVLQLDVDTIVEQDISDLWDLPIDDYYFAGAKEPFKSNDSYLYCNVGVALYNLRKLREDGKDDEIIAELNRTYYPFPDQDVMNLKCQGKILKMSSDYNACPWVEPFQMQKIVHFAANDNWQSDPLVQKWREMTWEDVRRMRNGELHDSCMSAEDVVRQ